MIDADWKTSTQLSLSIAEQKNSKLTLNLLSDKEFFSECKYQVTIDPTFSTDQDWQTYECSYVDNSHSNTACGMVVLWRKHNTFYLIAKMCAFLINVLLHHIFVIRGSIMFYILFLVFLIFAVFNGRKDFHKQRKILYVYLLSVIYTILIFLNDYGYILFQIDFQPITGLITKILPVLIIFLLSFVNKERKIWIIIFGSHYMQLSWWFILFFLIKNLLIFCWSYYGLF